MNFAYSVVLPEEIVLIECINRILFHFILYKFT